MASNDTGHDHMVARRLRAVRLSKGLSQRELARRTGVGSGTISQIESLTTQPSVSVLKKILDGVPMDLATFFSFELETADASVFRKDSHIDIGVSGIQYLLIAAQKADRAIQMIHEYYQPGKDSGRRRLTHEGEECGIVISGSLEVTVGEEKFTLGKGDAYYFPSTTPHHFRNSGDVVCEVVSACTPASF